MTAPPSPSSSTLPFLVVVAAEFAGDLAKGFCLLRRGVRLKQFQQLASFKLILLALRLVDTKIS